jgi:multiple sugar transport system substrate-binding protein
MRMARRDALQLGAGIFAGACLSPHMSLRAQTPLPAGTHPRLHEIEPGADLRLSGSPLSGRGEEAWIQNTHTFMRASGVRVQLSPSGGPPDIVFSLHHRLKQFSSDMAHPLDELATALGHSYGGWFPIARYYATDDYGRWISLPLGGYGTAIVYRPSLIRAAGFDTIPDDFEGFLHLCQRLFSIGAPAAFGFGSDLNGTWTDWLLSGFGSSLFDENGLGNDRTHLALEFARELFPYFASSSQSGTAESIYRAFLAGEISLTGSTPAIFRLSEWGREDIDHAYYPIGPSGLPSQSAHVILASVMSTTHYPRAALEYLRFMVERPQYVDLQRTSFLTHPLRAYDDNPLWREIPQLAAYKGALRNALPYPKNIDEWKARGIVQNMFARVLFGGESSWDAINWAWDAAQAICPSCTGLGGCPTGCVCSEGGCEEDCCRGGR